MWFLVFLRRQGVLKNRVKLGAFFLYQRDRGWLEFFGGKGVFSLFSGGLAFLRKCSFNTILLFLSIIIFLSGVVVFSFL